MNMGKPSMNDLIVDRSRLDEQWAEQPVLMSRFCEAEAEARRDYEDEQDRLKAIMAEIALEVRATPSKFGLEKTNNDIVKEVVDCHAEVVEQRRVIREARYALDVASGATISCVDRRKALQNEVDLWMAGYYSLPVEPRMPSQTDDDPPMNRTRRRVNARMRQRQEDEGRDDD
jgi:hypothetical protein